MPHYSRVICLVLTVMAALSVAAGGLRPPLKAQAQSVTGACLNPPNYVGSPDCVDLTFDACQQAWGGIDVYAAGKFFAGTCVEWRRQGETGRCVTYSPSYNCFAASRAQCETDERRNASYFFTTGATCPTTPPATQPDAPPAASTPPNDAITFKPELTIPGLLEGVWNISDTTIAEYIRVIFVAFIWVVGILATVMVVYGGIKWVAAAGNPGRINDARGIINDAIIGVLIALVAVVLLNTINPQLSSFKGISLSHVDKIPLESDTTPGKFNEVGHGCKTKGGNLIQREAACYIGSVTFGWPVAATHKITSRVGLRDLKVGTSCHPGTDFATAGVTGKQILAPHDGTIRAVEKGGGENTFELAADSYYTRYVHVKEVLVSDGQKVTKGTALGLTGGDPKDGPEIKKISGGPHLHVELYSANDELHDIDPCIATAEQVNPQIDYSGMK